MTDEVIVDRHDQVLVVTLNRPARRNALSRAVHAALLETWTAAKADEDLRAIVITATGDQAFCTGLDLQDVAEQGGLREVNPNVHEQMRLTPLNCDLWLPTIVAVNGVCAGAGLHFVADADVVIASDQASFMDPHVSVGQVAAVEPITLLPRIGLGNALRLTVLGREGRINANEAHRISLVDEVVSHDLLFERAMVLARIAASGSPAAIEASKRAIRGALQLPLSEALQEAWERLIAHRSHPDSLEGPKAFVGRRAALWQ